MTTLEIYLYLAGMWIAAALVQRLLADMTKNVARGFIVFLATMLWPFLFVVPLVFGFLRLAKFVARLFKPKGYNYVEFEDAYGPESKTPMEATDMAAWKKARKGDKGLTDQQIRDHATATAALPGPIAKCPSCEREDAAVLSTDGDPTYCLHCGWNKHGQGQSPVPH